VTGPVPPAREALLLDEHFPPALAGLLRQSGFDVIGIAEYPTMCGMRDDDVYRLAADQGRRVVTENVRDFRPMLTAAIGGQGPVAPLLLTTAKHFPRSAIGPLATALSGWLQRTSPPKQLEEWL